MNIINGKNNGSSLSQYALIIALIALALVPVFYVFGGTIIAYFECLYEGLSTKDLSISETTKGSTTSTMAYKAGSLGGTPDNPVLQCSDGNCNVDYGDFILSNIPENFNEYVESHGTSGGTDEIVNLLMQMADQMEEKGLEEQASNIRDIANLGHFIAQIENSHEEFAKECSQLPLYDEKSFCLSDKIDNNPPNKKIPENVAQLIPNFATRDTFQVAYEHTLETLDIGSAVWKMQSYFLLQEKYPYVEKQMKAIASSSPSDAIAYKYLQVMKDPNMPDSVKNVATSMLQYINEMALEQVATLQNIGGDLASGIAYSPYDFSTGRFSSKTIVETEIADYGPYKGQAVVKDGRIYDINRVFTPQYSTKTNLSSALICVSGKHRTTGKSCF